MYCISLSSVSVTYSFLLIVWSGMVLVKLMVAHLLSFQTCTYLTSTVLLSREPSVSSLCNINKRPVYCGDICLGLYTSNTSSGLSATMDKVFGGITQSLQENVWVVLPLGLKDFLLNPSCSSSAGVTDRRRRQINRKPETNIV